MNTSITYHHVVSLEIRKTDNFPPNGKTDQFYSTHLTVRDEQGNEQDICLIHDKPLVANFKRWEAV